MAPTSDCLKRMQNELKKLLKEEEDFKSKSLGTSRDLIQVGETIWLKQDNEQDLCSYTAFMCGNEGTPYENGFYLFKVNIQ